VSIQQEQPVGLDRLVISNAIRRLEVDNISWITALMYTILFGTPAGIGEMRQRLIRNAEEFGGFSRSFTGRKSAIMLRALWSGIWMAT
jgi:hypothetical protein